jgi:endoglycosylceramidase
MRTFVLFLVVAFTVALAAVSKVKLEASPDGSKIFMEASSGRQLFFHGVNAIVKGFPYVPLADEWDIDVSLSEKDHAALESLGINVYRLGTMWPGAEPTQGNFNATYFRELKKIIAGAEQHGIYSLLDMHQDVLSEKFCGEGIPSWAVIPIITDPNKDFPAPLAAPFQAVAVDGFPTRQDCAKFGWPSYYQTKACSSAFDMLYSNSSGILQAWSNFWVHVAKELGNQKAILGYELINEPWAGDIYLHPGLLVPSVADKLRLQPAYDYLAPRIRSIDSSSLIFFAGVTWDDVVPTGFEHPPGGDQYGDSSVFAFHYYNPPNGPLPIYLHQRVKDAQQLKVGAFITETMTPTRGHTDEDDGFVSMADAADSHLLSWATWEYKAFCKETAESLVSDSQQASYGACKTGIGGRDLWNDDGTLNEEIARRLARTYAPKIAGRVKSMRFNHTTSAFSLIYKLDTSIEAPTEIFAQQELHYPQGMKVEVFPPLKTTWNLRGNTISIRALPSVADGEIISIHITRQE